MWCANLEATCSILGQTVKWESHRIISTCRNGYLKHYIPRNIDDRSVEYQLHYSPCMPMQPTCLLQNCWQTDIKEKTKYASSRVVLLCECDTTFSCSTVVSLAFDPIHKFIINLNICEFLSIMLFIVRPFVFEPFPIPRCHFILHSIDSLFARRWS